MTEPEPRLLFGSYVVLEELPGGGMSQGFRVRERDGALLFLKRVPISGIKAEFTAEETPTYVEAVRQACRDISARFGGKHPPPLGSS